MRPPLRFRGPQVQIFLVGGSVCALFFGAVLRYVVADAYDPWWMRGGVSLSCLVLAAASYRGAPVSAVATGLRLLAIASTLWAGVLLWGNGFPAGASSGVLVIQALCMVLFPSTREALMYTLVMVATILVAGSAAAQTVASPLGLAATSLGVGLVFVFTTNHRALLDARLRRANDELELKVQQRTEELEHEVAERRAAESRALDASESKSRFLANMSHELRTPLNAILGYAELVGEEIEDDVPVEEVRADLAAVTSAANHLLALVNDVLDLSRIEAGAMELHPEDVDVESLVADALAEVRPMAAKHGNALASEALGAGVVHADRQRLRQILLNLLSNAAKFTHDGTIRVRSSRTDASLQLTVSDTGVGIAPDALKTLFQRFVQVDDSTTRRVGGTGLGLALSRDLARQMGGDITAVSTLGEGSAFTLTLPAPSASS